MLDFLSQNWPIIVVLVVLGLTTIRLTTKNPKYSMKEIAKNPLLIFKLFATAGKETAGIIMDVIDIIDDFVELTGIAVDDDNKKQKIVKAAEELKEEIAKGQKIINTTEEVAKAIEEKIQEK